MTSRLAKKTAWILALVLSWGLPLVTPRASAASPFTVDFSPLDFGPGKFIPSLLNRVVDILLMLVYPLALIGIIYTAFLLIANSNKPDAMAKVKKNVGNIVMGIFLVVFAVLIVNFVAKLFI